MSIICSHDQIIHIRLPSNSNVEAQRGLTSLRDLSRNPH